MRFEDIKEYKIKTNWLLRKKCAADVAVNSDDARQRLPSAVTKRYFACVGIIDSLLLSTPFTKTIILASQWPRVQHFSLHNCRA